MLNLTIKNLTPHDVNVLKDDGSYETFKPTGIIARAEQIYEYDSTVNGITFVTSSYGKPIDLPDPEEGVLLIVSKQTIDAAKKAHRSIGDLVFPAEPIRNDKGQIIGCKQLSFI